MSRRSHASRPLAAVLVWMPSWRNQSIAGLLQPTLGEWVILGFCLLVCIPCIWGWKQPGWKLPCLSRFSVWYLDNLDNLDLFFGNSDFFRLFQTFSDFHADSLWTHLKTQRRRAELWDVRLHHGCKRWRWIQDAWPMTSNIIQWPRIKDNDSIMIDMIGRP